MSLILTCSSSSVYFFIWDSHWVCRGRDAVSLVHWPTICPLHHVPLHHPTPFHPKRNRHPEIHKVHNTYLCSEWHPAECKLWCDLTIFSSCQCAGDAGCYVSVCGCDCQILPDGEPHCYNNSRAQPRVSDAVFNGCTRVCLSLAVVLCSSVIVCVCLSVWVRGLQCSVWCRPSALASR